MACRDGPAMKHLLILVRHHRSGSAFLSSCSVHPRPGHNTYCAQGMVPMRRLAWQTASHAQGDIGKDKLIWLERCRGRLQGGKSEMQIDSRRGRHATMGCVREGSGGGLRASCTVARTWTRSDCARAGSLCEEDRHGPWALAAQTRTGRSAPTTPTVHGTDLPKAATGVSAATLIAQTPGNGFHGDHAVLNNYHLSLWQLNHTL